MKTDPIHSGHFFLASQMGMFLYTSSTVAPSENDQILLCTLNGPGKTNEGNSTCSVSCSCHSIWHPTRSLARFLAFFLSLFLSLSLFAVLWQMSFELCHMLEGLFSDNLSDNLAIIICCTLFPGQAIEPFP